MKFEVMATKAPSPCASGNGRSNTVKPRNSVPRCTNNPVPPTMANIRKRSVTTSLVNFASTSPRKSSATMESSLLSPCSREPKVKGTSTVLSLPCAVATMSSRILKPCVESCGASSLEAVGADHEEAAHGIGDGNAEHAPGDGGRKGAGARPALVETVGAAALDIAAADHELGLPALQQRRASSAAASRHAAGRRPSRRHRARWRRGCPRCRRPTGRAGRCGGCSGRGGPAARDRAPRPRCRRANCRRRRSLPRRCRQAPPRACDKAWAHCRAR